MNLHTVKLSLVENLRFYLIPELRMLSFTDSATKTNGSLPRGCQITDALVIVRTSFTGYSLYFCLQLQHSTVFTSPSQANTVIRDVERSLNKKDYIIILPREYY